MTDPRESKIFGAGQTVGEFYEKQRKETGNLHYYRLPNRSPETMLSEQVREDWSVEEGRGGREGV